MPEGKETNEKEKLPEEAPSHSAGGMVSENTLIKNIKKLNRGEKDVEIPPLDVLLLLLIEKMIDMNKNLERIADAFEGASTKIVKPKPKIEKDTVKPDVAPETANAPITSEPATLRIEEIVQTFKDYEELVELDFESSTQFVIIKPKEYLKDKWNDIMSKVRNLGGEWVSQGKEGHWLVPKMSKNKSETEQNELESEQVQKPLENATPIEKTKILFPQDLEDMLNFEESNSYIIIKPRQFLGTENFAKIASIVREAGGEYISAGKQSHFRISIDQ